MSAQPEPPRGARLVRANGDVLPLELVYVGKEQYDDAIIDAWEAVLTVAFDPSDRLAVDVIPARCSITLRLDVTP